ncbi:MAG TPA: RNA polymerase sigma factor [Kofleriaceae bacterium]|nr:RNA polymerase sigma factor [Kofleriaceae bacterium]
MLAPVTAVDARDPDRDPIAVLIEEGKHREAAGRCAGQHGAAIGRLCMALLGSQAEAEEAAQETLLAACSQMGAYRAEGTVRAWLFGIARRVCARRFENGARERRRLALVRDPSAPWAEAADGDSPAASFATMRRARAVRAALAALRPSEREALILRYQAGLSFREIAAQSGIDEAAARKRASRGLAQLRRVLRSENMEG